MKILIAPDKFKGSLTAAQAGDAIWKGFREVMPDADFDLAAIADGGEGTVDVFLSRAGALRRQAVSQDARGRGLLAEFAWMPDERLAVVEMSAASGLARIPPERRDILRSTTFGTGQLLIAALALSPEVLAIGLGGSATNDGGAGLAAALGWRFQDRLGREVIPTPENLREIEKILPPPPMPKVQMVALSDVRNPLLGERGCSRVYGRQKGASEGDMKRLEEHLTHFADVCERTFGETHRHTPGAGAAGGTGFGLLTFCGAEIVSGFDWIAERIHLEDRVAACDLVVTGEGSIDFQTWEGKGPGALAALATRHGKPCLAFAGRVENGAGRIFTRCIPIGDPGIKLAENLSRGAEFLRAASCEAARSLIK